MGGSPKTVESTSKTEPWAGAKAPLLRLYGSAEKAYNETNRNPYEGQMYAGPNQIQAGAAYDLAQNGFGANAGKVTAAADQLGAAAQGLAGTPAFSANTSDSRITRQNAGVVEGLGGKTAAAATPLLNNASVLEGMAGDLASGKWLSAEANPYLQGAVSAATRDITNAYQRNIAPSLEDAAIKSGAYGGSRNGIATGLAASETQQNLADTVSGIYANNYQAERDRMMQAGNVYGQAADQRATYGNMNTAAGGLYGQGSQMRMSAAENDRANYAATQDSQLKQIAGLGSAAQTQSGLYDSANQQKLLDISGRASAGQQVQAWDQAQLDDAFTRYQLQQQAPWAGVSELLSVLNGGGFQTTTSTQPNPNYKSPLQQIMGLGSMAAGMVNPLGALFK